MNKNKSNFVKLAAVAVVSSMVTFLLIVGVGTVGARQQQQVTGNENQSVTLDQAVKYVQSYTMSPTSPTIKGGYFAKVGLEKILSQAGCVGIRYYYSKKDDGSSSLVVVGVDYNGTDLTAGPMIDNAFPCPPFCGSPSPLNK
jgi:hypothetical protein